MDNRNRSRRTGTTLASIAIMVATFATAPAFAQAAATVNGVEISALAFEQYLETRIQKPAAEATAEERENVLAEMKDIYLLTTLPQAEELAEGEEIQAQIELQYRALSRQNTPASSGSASSRVDNRRNSSRNRCSVCSRRAVSTQIPR